MKPSSNPVINYLKIVGAVSGLTGNKSCESFVLRHGQDFKPRRLPGGYAIGTPGNCFGNCSQAAIDDPSLTYCEGYALSVAPTMHAWCLDKDGMLLELTWKKPGSNYFGVPFQTAFMKRHLRRSGYYGLIDSWKSNWPLLRGRYPNREWYKQLKGQQ